MYNLIQAKRTDLVASGMLTLGDVLLHKLYFVSNIPHALLTSLNVQNMDVFLLKLRVICSRRKCPNDAKCTADGLYIAKYKWNHRAFHATTIAVSNNRCINIKIRFMNGCHWQFMV
jgi:hypothetical protein